MDDIAPTAEAHARFEPQGLADLEDALALAQYRARQASGETPAGIPHAEVRVRLGLERG